MRIEVGKIIPSLNLRDDAGNLVALRSPSRENTIIVLLHAAPCAECSRYIEAIERALPDIEEWDGRIVLIETDQVAQPTDGHANEQDNRIGEPLAPDPRTTADAKRGATRSTFAAGAPITLVDGRDNQLADRIGCDPPAVIISDQWGEVFAAEAAGQEHAFLETGELVEWARFLAIQCPECQGEAR